MFLNYYPLYNTRCCLVSSLYCDFLFIYLCSFKLINYVKKKNVINLTWTPTNLYYVTYFSCFFSLLNNFYAKYDIINYFFLRKISFSNLK